MQFYYKVTHTYISTTKPHKHKFDIGIYTDYGKAIKAIEQLKTKSGFKNYPNGFRLSKVFCFKKPKLLDNTYWQDGFVTYNY